MKLVHVNGNTLDREKNENVYHVHNVFSRGTIKGKNISFSSGGNVVFMRPKVKDSTYFYFISIDRAAFDMITGAFPPKLPSSSISSI